MENALPLLLATLLLPSHLHSQDWKSFRANPKRMEERILKLSEFGKNPEGGVSRVAFSEADIQGRKYITALLEAAGLKVRVDTAGNIIGRREGRDAKLPVILFGSHIDSVPKGGNYDGDVGVIGSLECIEVLNEQKFTTGHPLEVIIFSDEEGGLVGSRAIIGDLSENALKVISHTGKTIREGILAIGGDPDKLKEAQRKPAEILAFLELHIEQGGILDAEEINIGVVEGIVGINWWDVTVIGFANHAGTTPMDQRKDALLTAAKIVDSVNKIARSIPGRHVATVGRIHAEPGAPNVIPGKVVMSLEIRDLSKEKIDQVFQEILKSAKQIASDSGTTINFSALDVTAVPAPTDQRLRKIVDESARSIGLTTKTLPSGAGHDAQDMARIVPTGMIFVPSVAGISHSPKEFTHATDMANGASVLLHTILRLDRDGLD
ncbi:Zn-dependent hydrolase [bacterium]|nr:Zn-dependent hydrolase [bacterium]MCI0602826.1 Zn-dependent hydrolase [bacterium]